MPVRRRVLIVNDDPLFRANLREVLEPDLDVVGEARDCLEAVALTSVEPVDLIVMGMPTPPQIGVTAGRALFERNPPLVVVVLESSEGEGAGQPRPAGTRAYVRKSSELAGLVEILLNLESLSASSS
jgi:DNA-binding NarL/FixJ family response regulator